MKAVILAAGYATRLYPLTVDKPKCLLPVGGRPILDFLGELITRASEIDEVVIVTNSRFYSQLAAWAKQSRLSVPVSVLDDGTDSNENRRGAIGDLDFALQKNRIDTDILMLASDNLFEGGLEDFIQFARSKKGAVSVGVYDIGDPAQAAGKYGVIELDGTARVSRIEEKPAKPRTSLIGMGIYYFPKESLPLVKRYLDGPQAQDAPGHYVRWLMDKVNIFGFVFSGLWYDIGDLNALNSADKIFGDKKHGR